MKKVGMSLAFILFLFHLEKIKVILLLKVKMFYCFYSIQMIMDAMSIRRHINYYQHPRELCGYVDLGEKADTDVEASEV